MRQAMSPGKRTPLVQGGAAAPRDPRARRRLVRRWTAPRATTRDDARGPRRVSRVNRPRGPLLRGARASRHATQPCVARRLGVRATAVLGGASRVSRHARRCPAWRRRVSRALPCVARRAWSHRDAALRGASRVVVTATRPAWRVLVVVRDTALARRGDRHPRLPAWRVARGVATLPAWPSRVAHARALHGASRVIVARAACMARRAWSRHRDAACRARRGWVHHPRRCRARRVAGSRRDAAVPGASRVIILPRAALPWRVAGESSRATQPCMARRGLIVTATQPCMARRGRVVTRDSRGASRVSRHARRCLHGWRARKWRHANRGRV